MSFENCDCYDINEYVGKVLYKKGLDNKIIEKAIEAAQQVLSEAGLANELYLASIEISEIPENIVASVLANGCGYRRVCDRNEQVCDWYIDDQGKRWRRCYTKPICRMVPNPCS